MTVGLVLGAGGSIGWAYHLGVIEGIQEATGCAPADADRVIGTSAGGAIAASVLAGNDTEAVLVSITQPMSDRQRDEMRQSMGETRRVARLLRPQAPGMIRRGGIVGLLGLVPAGAFPTWPLRRFPTDGLDAWPPNLWIPSVRLGDGETVVFGRDRTDVDLRDVVEATSAVPGLFRPKEIDGERFVDGAVASATHADLLLDDPPDLVLIASPMTRPGRGPVRWRAKRQLQREVDRLRLAGSEVVVVEPTAELMELAGGYPRTRPEAGPAIVDAARRQVVETCRALDRAARRASGIIV
ncbi:MAG: patatin-like phospholipase family protein [Actinomycetota bacterium]